MKLSEGSLTVPFFTAQLLVVRTADQAGEYGNFGINYINITFGNVIQNHSFRLQFSREIGTDSKRNIQLSLCSPKSKVQNGLKLTQNVSLDPDNISFYLR